MPLIRWRVVWALDVTMERCSPRIRFKSVDLPTFGLPMMLIKPDLCSNEKYFDANLKLILSLQPQKIQCGVEQLVARWAHNPKVTGSSPVPAT